MNRLILKRSQREQKVFKIEKEATETIEHLRKVLKVQVGDSLKVTFLDEGLGSVKVHSLTPSIELHLLGNIEPTHLEQIHLLVGVSRPPTLKKILEHGTSLGVTHFHFFKARLSDKSYLQSKVLEEKNIEQLIRLGVSQSSQICVLPKVTIHQNLEQALREIPQKRYLLSLMADKNFTQLGHTGSEPVALAIGPERGWIPEEEDYLTHNNFLPVKVSKHTLRVEIATFSAIAQLNMFN